MLFDFINDLGNYQDRVVGRYDGNGTMVSTARVSDGRQPYETAFEHPDYNNGKMVIVEAYDSKELAAEGHARWLKIMIDGPLPDVLIKCHNSEVSQFLSEEKFPRKPS